MLAMFGRLIVLGLAALVLPFAACSGNGSSPASPTTVPSATAIPPTVALSTVGPANTPTPMPTVMPPATATPPLTGVCPTNPDPAPPSVAVVTAPTPNATVTSPLTVTGMVAAFEAQFEAELLDSSGNVLVWVHGMSAAGQQLSPFTVTLPFNVQGSTPGCLRIYQKSAKDGTMSKVVLVPLVLSP